MAGRFDFHFTPAPVAGFQRVWGVAELYGRTQSVTAVSTCRSLASPGGGLPAGAAPDSPVSVMQDSLELGGTRPVTGGCGAGADKRQRTGFLELETRG